MKCPHCGRIETHVIDSRPAEEGSLLRRRRQCDFCHARFTTHERILQNAVAVVKKDGRREEFSREKLKKGVAKACNKRPVATESVTALVESVESELRREGIAEVSAERVGEMVMDRLLQLDEVAYVRFASVYQRFDDVKRFAQLLDRISRRSRREMRPETSGNKKDGGKVRRETEKDPLITKKNRKPDRTATT